MSINPFQAQAIEVALNGRYKVVRELRVGGQGAVFQAHRLLTQGGDRTDELVALKLHLDPRQDIRVEREIKAMLNMSHPCLSRMVEHGTCDIGGAEIRYIAWEFIDGIALDTRLMSGPLDVASVIRIASDVSSAISAIWKKRIVHRDVNPKNIMLRNSGGAVLIDLGGARHLDERSVTAPGSTFGTLGYFSPEQYRAERALTSASDVFSLGVVLEQSLSGRHPTNFDQHRLVAAPPRCLDVCRSTDNKLAEVVDRMLSVRAAFRPSVEELLSTFSTLGRETNGISL
jgi:serine/threonine protein kinase